VGSPSINRAIAYLNGQAESIPGTAEAMSESRVDTSELRRQIAAGEYRLDASAIAEAILGRADREFAAASDRVLETGQADSPAGTVD
jgi:hypothetical protein